MVVAMASTDADLREYSGFARTVAILVIVLGFVPYAAFPLGQNTNLPWSSLGCIILILLTIRHRGVFWVTFAILVIPVLTTFVQQILAPHPVLIASLVAWVAYSLVVPGSMAAYLILDRRLRPVLAFCLIASSLMVFIQYIFIMRGTLPWLWYYDMPGYHPVIENAQSIIDYNTRPFGLFPEPSFTAGTLAMVVMLVLTLRLAEESRYGLLEWTSITLTLGVLVLSASGSAVITLILIAMAAAFPLLRRSAAAATLFPLLVLATLGAASSILNDRGTGVANLSWVDRTASLLIGLDKFTDSVTNIVAGLGIGMTTYYFEHDGMPAFRHEHYSSIPDVYSVTLRFLIEAGIFVGGCVLLWIISRFFVPGQLDLSLVALATLACWIVVTLLTITYHSAFWVCGVPGVMAIVRGNTVRGRWGVKSGPNTTPWDGVSKPATDAQ